MRIALTMGKWGGLGRLRAARPFARLKIKDLRYTQDTCSEVFGKMAPHLLTHAERFAPERIPGITARIQESGSSQLIREFRVHDPQ